MKGLIEALRKDGVREIVLTEIPIPFTDFYDDEIIIKREDVETIKGHYIDVARAEKLGLVNLAGFLKKTGEKLLHSRFEMGDKTPDPIYVEGWFVGFDFIAGNKIKVK